MEILFHKILRRILSSHVYVKLCYKYKELVIEKIFL